MSSWEKYRICDVLESILFASGTPTEISDICEAMEWSEDDVTQAVATLNKEYEEQNKAFKIIYIEKAVQMCTREEFAPYIQQVLGAKPKQNLSVAALETLSIIAYNQPITRNSISYIRGVNSDGAVTRLVERGLITEAGRLNAPGKPILYATTDDFLRAFGLESLSDLPELAANLPEDYSLENQQEFEI